MVTLEHYEGFTDSKKLVYLEENKPIFKQLKNIDYDLALVFANGRQVDKFYTPKENDLLVIRSVAGSMTTAGLIVSGVSLVVGVVAGVSAYKSNLELERVTRQTEEQNKTERNINKLPYLRGASNTLATGKTQPYIIGTHLFTPYILNSGKNENYKGFTTIDGTDGNKSFYNIVLEGGFNNQVIQKVFADDVELVTLGGETPQDDEYSLNKNGLFASENNYIEIAQGHLFTKHTELNNVIVEKTINQVLNKKPSSATKDGTDEDKYKDLIYSLESNSMGADVTILLNGLCHFDKDGVKQPSSRTVGLQYSTDYNRLLAQGKTEDEAKLQANWQNFNEFNQVVSVVDRTTTYTSAVYKATVSRIYNLSDTKIKKIVKESSHYGWEYVSGDTSQALRNGADSYTYEITGRTKSGITYYWEVTIKAYKETVTEEIVTKSSSNTFERNTLNQLRYYAHQDFSASEIDKNYPVAIKLSSNDRQSAEGQDYNDVYLDNIKSYIYNEDYFESNNTLQNAKVIDSKSAELSTLIGLHIEATKQNEEKLKSIQVITSGVAKTWNGSAWSDNKTVTSNPASWLLEVLTSDKHAPSKVTENEIDLQSLGAWYEDCQTNGLTIDYVITSGVTKQSILELICNAGRGVLYRNIYGKIAVGFDGEKQNAYGVLNEQNLVSFEYTKEIKREPDGLNIEYIDADKTYQKNNFVVMFNQYDSNGNFDPFGKNRSADSVIQTQKLEGVTSWDNALKHAHYLMKCQRLRPKTCKAVVGMEGEYFIPMTKYLVQHPSLKIGLGNAEIKELVYDSTTTAITGLKLYEAIQLDNTNNFNIIVQCVGTANGVEYCTPLSIAVKNYNGRTKTIEFKTPISTIANVKPHEDDILSYGYGVDTVTSPMLLTGIENNGNGYILTLVDYNTDIFNDDIIIPEYQPNVTQPQKPVNYEVDLASTTDLMAMIDETANGLKNISIPVQLKLYKRAKSKPSTTGITSDAQYNYNTGVLTWVTPSGANGWTITEPDGTDPMYLTVASISGKGTVSVSKSAWVTPINYVKNGEDGENSAEVYNIVSNYNLITRYTNGTLSANSLTFSFYKANESSRGEISIYYELFTLTANQWTLRTSGTGTTASINVGDYDGFNINIYESSTKKDVPLGSETVLVVAEGSGAIVTDLSNQNVIVPCDENGTPTSFDDTDSVVYVLCGAEGLTYGDPTIKGQFSIEEVLENVTASAGSGNNVRGYSYGNQNGINYASHTGAIYENVNFYILPKITSFTAEKGSRTLIIKGTNYDGKSFQIKQIQNFVKSIKAHDGLNVATVVLYQRSATVPQKPTAVLNYTFDKPPVMSWGTSGSSNGWLFDKPAVSEERLPLYEIRSTALSNTLTDTIDPVEWGDVKETQVDSGVSKTEVERMLAESEENLKNAIKPTFDITLDGSVYAVNEDGIIKKAQTVTAIITCQRNGVSIPFEIARVSVPGGFVYNIDGDKVRFIVQAGTILTNGSFEVYCRATDITNISYEDENGVPYTDETNDEYSAVSFDIEELSSHTFNINFSVVKGGTYYNTINSVSDLPTNVIYGDYFTYTGVTVESDKSITGQFRTSAVYSWDGLYWEEENDGVHLARCLSDVLSVADADLEKNNSKAYEYIDHLTANSIFAKRVISKLIETDILVSNSTFTKEITVIENTENALIYNLSKDKADKTIIKGGYIDTNKIDVAELNAKLVTTDLLTVSNIKAPDGETLWNAETGKLKTKYLDADGITANNVDITGKITATSGSFSGEVNATSGTFTNVELENIYLKNKIFLKYRRGDNKQEVISAFSDLKGYKDASQILATGLVNINIGTKVIRGIIYGAHSFLGIIYFHFYKIYESGTDTYPINSQFGYINSTFFLLDNNNEQVQITGISCEVFGL